MPCKQGVHDSVVPVPMKHETAAPRMDFTQGLIMDAFFSPALMTITKMPRSSQLKTREKDLGPIAIDHQRSETALPAVDG